MDLSKFYRGSAAGARPENAITGVIPRSAPARGAASGAAACVQRTDSPGVVSPSRHPRRGVLQGAATGAGVGENRGALRNRASRGGPIDGPRGHAESVVQRRLKRRTRVWGCGSVSQMWTELWVKCAQIHQMLYLFLRRPQNLVAIRLKVSKKRVGRYARQIGSSDPRETSQLNLTGPSGPVFCDNGPWTPSQAFPWTTVAVERRCRRRAANRGQTG